MGPSPTCDPENCCLQGAPEQWGTTQHAQPRVLRGDKEHETHPTLASVNPEGQRGWVSGPLHCVLNPEGQRGSVSGPLHCVLQPQGLHYFSLKVQVANSFGFLGLTVSIETSQLNGFSVTAAADDL